MKKIILPLCAVTLVANPALAANTNAPVIIDANATSAYVNDGSSTNRMSPPVPGIAPLRSLTVKPQLPGRPSLANTNAPLPPQEAPTVAAPRKPLSASDIAEANPNATFRFIDKRPLGMNIAPIQNESVYTLDDVPKDQQRNVKQESPAALSPAR